MRVSCPACGADMTLDLLLTHEAARRAVATALHVQPAVAERLMKYLALFRTPKRQLSMDRVAALLEEIVPLLRDGYVTRRGRRHPAPPTAWQQAFDTVLAARDAGKLALPLKSHGYLMEVVIAAGERVEAGAERQLHDRLARGERPGRDVGSVTAGGLAPLAAAMPALPPAGAAKLTPAARKAIEDLRRMTGRRDATPQGAGDE